MKQFGKIVRNLGSTQSRNTATESKAPQGFINESVFEWPSWIGNQTGQAAKAKKLPYSESISYERSLTVPICILTRTYLKSYQYYIDQEIGQVYFYPVHDRYFRQIKSKPTEQELKENGYDSHANYESIKVVPIDIALPQIKRFN